MDFTSPEQKPEENETIRSEHFWPTVSTQHYRETQRQHDGAITNARLKTALINAVIEVNRELADWQKAQMGLGYQQLVEVPAMKINEDSELCLLYQRTVYGYAHASLAERYRDFDTTPAGNKKAEALSLTIENLRRDAIWAIQRIKGDPHNIAELI
uniref:Phage head completion protein (GPL) n=1 Tax=Arsenophonus endosymbiont of Trialeurodes vaporariorum TaxID=235567 RepID=A0A3B0MKX6_9GAMM